VRLRFALVAGWAALIFIGSSFPNPPGASGGEWQYDLAHMVEYGVLGALVLVALRGYRAGARVMALALGAWAIAVFYGMSDEFHQSFVPNRDANWMDVGFDALGAAVGVGVLTGIRGGRASRRA
jgi:VanZ family protein